MVAQPIVEIAAKTKKIAGAGLGGVMLVVDHHVDEVATVEIAAVITGTEIEEEEEEEEAVTEYQKGVIEWEIEVVAVEIEAETVVEEEIAEMIATVLAIGEMGVVTGEVLAATGERTAGSVAMTATVAEEEDSLAVSRGAGRRPLACSDNLTRDGEKAAFDKRWAKAWL